MSDSTRAQSATHHARLVPGFHFVTLSAVALYLLYAVWRIVFHWSIDAAAGLCLAVALAGVSWYMRIFPLTVQDRVIRLEMRLRLASLLPADLASRVGELRRGQLIALRFASDAELPDLVRTVLEKGIRDQREIKSLIRDWQADHLRC